MGRSVEGGMRDNYSTSKLCQAVESKKKLNLAMAVMAADLF